jgi:hypothetical protein
MRGACRDARGSGDVPSKGNIMSRSIHKIFFAVLAGLALSLGAGNAAADVVYYLSGQNGNIFGSGPFGSVTVHLESDNTTADITFTAYSPYNFMDGSAAAVNVNASSFNVTNVSPLQNCGNCTGITGWGAAPSVDGFGSFNLAFDLHDGSANTVTSISFTLANTSGTWTESTVLTANGNGSKVAAHMVNLANTSCTGYASDSGGSSSGSGACGPLAEVPIPAAAWLFGSGLLGLIGIARRRIRGDSPVLASPALA